MSAPALRMSRRIDRAIALPLLTLLVVTALLVTALGATAWIVLLHDGLYVAAVLLAGCGWGIWPAAWLGLARRSALQQVCAALALGLGMLSSATLALGTAGVLNRPTAWGLIAAGAVFGIARVAMAGRRCDMPGVVDGTPLPSSEEARGGSRRWGAVGRTLLLLPLAVPLAIALFGACLPPGMLWHSEARGYDVLEYHLQVPREYFDAGRIHFLPHNVYASFPQQMESLYLLLMHVVGGVLPAAIPAQLLHVACGVLTVVALAAWSPTGWLRWIVVLAGGSVPWLVYLGSLAYVELGMLFFAAVAAGLVLDQLRPDTPTDWRTALAAGLCAGLAGGCKYTALALVAAALALAWLAACRAPLRVPLGRLSLYVAGAVVAFSPWLIRNTAFTGNPVYPFAYRWFGGAAWSAEQDQRWSHGHAVRADRSALGARLRSAWDELPAGRFYGSGLFLLAAFGLALGWSRRAALLLTWSGLIVVLWMMLTHMPGRFALPLVIPLALLVGGVQASIHVAVPVLACIALVGAVLNADDCVKEFRRNVATWQRYGVALPELVGGTEGFAQSQPLEGWLPADGSAWIVGEARAFYLPRNVHYTVVFSRDPWLEYCRTATPAEAVAWLRTQNVSSVVFSWAEIERLRGTYGFADWVTPDWVASLAAAGLRRLEPPAGVRLGDVEVYAVPRE